MLFSSKLKKIKI